MTPALRKIRPEFSTFVEEPESRFRRCVGTYERILKTSPLSQNTALVLLPLQSSLEPEFTISLVCRNVREGSNDTSSMPNTALNPLHLDGSPAPELSSLQYRALMYRLIVGAKPHVFLK